MKLSIIIPSRNEMFLSRTVDDIFAKARGDFEVIVVLDEKEQELTPRDRLIVLKKEGRPGMKSALTQAIKVSSGEYIMKSDAHCMFAEGFDVTLLADAHEDWIVIPRRYSLEPKDWSIRDYRPIIDYEYMPFPYVADLLSVKTGGKWHSRRDERKDILIDDNMVFQGSVWFLNKNYFWNTIGGFNPTNTGDDFLLESDEIALKTWLSGGRVVTNKKTWYAHLHKGSEYGRGYFVDKRPMKRQRIYHVNYWMHDSWPGAKKPLKWLVSKFWPIPSWPEDWEDPKYEAKWREANGLEPVVAATL